MTSKIVIFGGSFDPVHIGHIEIISHLATQFDKCIVVPCYVSPFKLDRLTVQSGGDAAVTRNSCLGHVLDVHSRQPETTPFSRMTTTYHSQELESGGDATEASDLALGHVHEQEANNNCSESTHDSAVGHDCHTSPQQRLDMLEIALHGIEKVRVDSFELSSAAPSYTYLSIEHFAEQYPEAEIYFAIGTDSIINLSGWKNVKRITQLAKLYVIPRPHFAMNESCTRELESCAARYEVAGILGRDISSSEIKVASAFGRIGEYVTADVARFIHEHQLYRDYDYIVSRYGEFRLSESRIAHIFRTVKVGINLAKLNQVSTDKVIVALLLHDIAKNTIESDLAAKGYAIPTEIALYPDKCKHALLGAVIARCDFHIASDDILAAITNHTTADEQMSVLDEIVFLSDYIEEERKFKGIDNIRKIVYSDIKQGMLAVLTSTIDYLTITNSDICIKSVLALKAYQNKGVNQNHGKKNS